MALGPLRSWSGVVGDEVNRAVVGQYSTAEPKIELLVFQAITRQVEEVFS
jgi:hypothetical protein